MDKATRPATAADMRHKHLVEPAQPAALPDMLDHTMFQEFFSLLGTPQALFWLAHFRDELNEEFTACPKEQLDAQSSRKNIHNFCGRAGFVGFTALHEACLGFLDADTGQTFPDAKYGEVHTEAKRACAEIARQHAVQA